MALLRFKHDHRCAEHEQDGRHDVVFFAVLIVERVLRGILERHSLRGVRVVIYRLRKQL